MSTSQVPSLRVNLDSSSELSSVMTLATGQVQSAEIRTETLNGREYTVVPVVAIVEGVLHGANASSPEFAPASEFGKFPKAWDGRPVVMNHPQISGVFVSASIPSVLEEFGMGLLFNSKVEDNKLKTEAWLDNAKIQELGGEILSTFERINNGDLVEVSVGAWLDVKPGKGTYKGKSYMGTWQNVAPDHLAFLSEGVKGACSIEDGCGVPRLFRANHAVIGEALSTQENAPCCDACAQGTGTCEGTQEPSTQELSAEAIEVLVSERRAASFQELVSTLDLGEESLSVNTIPGNMAFDDIARLLEQSLQEALNIPVYDFIVYAITQNVVVYKIWGVPGLNQRTYSVSEDGAVSLAGEVTPVNLLTRIVPRMTTNASERNDHMTQATGEGSEANPNAVTDPGSAPGNDGSQAAPAAAPTFEALLAAAPQEQREAFENGVRMFQERKTALVKSIIACERNKFTEEQLGKMEISTLENLAELGNVATFEGRAPAPQVFEGVDPQNQKPTVAAANTSYLTAPAKGSEA